MSYAQPNYSQARCGPEDTYQERRAMNTNGKQKDIRFEPPAKDDAKELEKIAKIIDAFRHVDSKIPSSYMAAFLRVALDPGQGPTTYAQQLNTRQPIASRILLEMGKIDEARERSGEIGLVNRMTAPDNLRSQNYFLTHKGRMLMNKLIKIIREED